MRVIHHIKSAFRNIRYSKLRSLLAMLGIMVGTASVVTLVTVGNLATQQALEQFKSLGIDLMSVSFSPKANNDYEITLKDLTPLQDNIPSISEMAPYTFTNLPVSYQKTALDSVVVVGATQNLANLVNIRIKQGRFISDLDKAQYFCVLGKGLLGKLNMFSPLGERIKVGDNIFSIIGVADEWVENSFFRQNINESLIIPLNTITAISPSTNLNSLILQLKNQANIDAVKTDINEYFAKNIPGFNLSIQSAKEIIHGMENQQSIFTLLLGLIGAISLLVGGIGVMNIMLASVAERRNEIGLRLALGAQPYDVQLMFLIEAIMLSLIGGSLGVILGIVGSFVIAKFSGWPFTFLFIPPLIGFTVSLLVSLFFGFYPAYLASRLNPIDSLRAN